MQFEIYLIYFFLKKSVSDYTIGKNKIGKKCYRVQEESFGSAGRNCQVFKAQMFFLPIEKWKTA